MDDWIKLKEERLRIDDPARFTQDWDAFRDHLQATGEVVQVGAYPYGVFGTPRDLMGAEEVLISFYTQPEVIKDMIDHLTTLWISVYEKVAEQVQIDHIHIWEDMSGKQGSLISPQMVREYMMPCYDRIADFARSAGVRLISVDTDGDCAELVPIMMEHGINVFLPFEVQAGNDILEYRHKYPELGIIGGLDKRALAASKADIDKEVEKAREMCKFGRYIPGFDHLIPPDVPWENYQYAAERLKEVCYGERS
jgi:uroporphyrinogen decarboxylase